MPTIDHESSIRLRLLNFPLIVGVVYIHAYTTTIRFSGSTLGTEQPDYLTDFVRILISQGIARLAVPMFFLIAGYLFLAGSTWSWRVYGSKLASRARTLLVPFLFWTLLGLAIRHFGQSIPAVAAYFAGDGPPIADYSAFAVLNAVFGFVSFPEAYHFWFIRDLMLLIILSPLIVLILEYTAMPFITAVFLAWITGTWPIAVPDAVGVLFFSAGCYLAMKGKSLFALDRYGIWFVIFYLPALLADVIWYDEPFNNCLHRCGIVVGIVAALWSTRLALGHEQLKNALVWLGGASFFVYAAHEPLLGIVRTVAFQLVPFDWPYAMLSIYLLLPLVLIAFLVGVHRLLAGYAAKPLGIITGGR
jgi:surface polysaccharide O-acyltransferase-like enzyme